MKAKVQITRRLTLVDCTLEDNNMEKALKLAFATSDQKHINQHFGSCQSLAIYLLTRSELRFHEVIAFEQADQDGNEDKLAVRIKTLEGCAAVYCQAIGASAIAQLKKIAVQPLKVASGTGIKTQLNLLQKQLSENPALWMLQALEVGKDPERFDEMETEGWDE
jgi:nitrogen fixation protein NifX